MSSEKLNFYKKKKKFYHKNIKIIRTAVQESVSSPDFKQTTTTQYFK
jgi:hypothetical protein